MCFLYGRIKTGRNKEEGMMIIVMLMIIWRVDGEYEYERFLLL